MSERQRSCTNSHLAAKRQPFLIDPDVMLKFIGKVKPNVTFEEGDIILNSKELLNLFFANQKEAKIEEEATLSHTVQILSAIINYDEQVVHLDKLITSFQTYHKKTSEIMIEE